MQLPRGRFDRFVRDETISGIIKELGEAGYSGSCSGIFGESAAELIFEGGKIILAESSEKKGEDMLTELNSSPDGEVAAELSIYDPAQLKLVREFNPKCVVRKEVFDSLFSGISEGKESEDEIDSVIVEKVSGPEEAEITPETDEGNEVYLDESEINSIVTSFRSGARDLLKKINLDHLVVEGKSGKDNND